MIVSNGEVYNGIERMKIVGHKKDKSKTTKLFFLYSI